MVDVIRLLENALMLFVAGLLLYLFLVAHPKQEKLLVDCQMKQICFHKVIEGSVCDPYLTGDFFDVNDIPTPTTPID